MGPESATSDSRPWGAFPSTGVPSGVTTYYGSDLPSSRDGPGRPTTIMTPEILCNIDESLEASLQCQRHRSLIVGCTTS